MPTKIELKCETCQKAVVWGNKDGSFVKDIQVAPMVSQPFKLQVSMRGDKFEKLEIEHKVKRKGVLHIIR